MTTTKEIVLKLYEAGIRIETLLDVSTADKGIMAFKATPENVHLLDEEWERKK